MGRLRGSNEQEELFILSTSKLLQLIQAL